MVFPPNDVNQLGSMRGGLTPIAAATASTHARRVSGSSSQTLYVPAGMASAAAVADAASTCDTDDQ